MAPPLLWQLLLHALVFNLLGFPSVSSGFTLGGHRPAGLRARYTRSIWSPSYDPPTTSSFSTPGNFYGSAPYANGTQLSTSLGAQQSSSSLTTGLPFSYPDPIDTPRSWTPQTSSNVPTNFSVTTTPDVPTITPGCSSFLTPGSVPANVSSTTGYASFPHGPGVTPGPLTPGFSSSSFDYSTWLSPSTPVRSGFNTSWPVSTYPESVITSTETINGSMAITFLPPLTTSDKSDSSPLQSFVATETTVSGSVIATFVPAPTTADDLSSSSELRSFEITSSSTVNGSTIVVVLPPQTTDDESPTGSPSTTASTSSGASSTASTATSDASATALPVPIAPTPSPTAGTSASGSILSSESSQAAASSAAGMQSGIPSISFSSTSTVVAAIIITPIPVVLSEGEKSSTKDPEKTTGSHSDSVSEDQDGHQLTLHIPVLPGGCWFCPPGPPGFRLPELTLPGVYPPMKPPGPGWMTIPALTIDGNGNPTFEPEPSDDPKASTPASASATVTSSDSSSQTGSPSGSASRSFVTSFSTSVSSCITTTTEVCSTLTSYGVDASGSTTTTSVASQCSPTVGCSVLASNTASATTSAASGCWEYDFTLDNQEFENEDEQTFQTVDIKAAAHGLDRIGACSFTRTELNPSSMVTVPVTINIPSWPAVSELAAMSTATEWYAATMASDMDGSCPTLTYTTFDSAQSLTASPLMIGVGGVPATYSLDGDKPSVNVDHAYDIALIIEFLEFIMDSQSDTAAYCESFNDFFIGGEGDPGDDDEPRLQTFFNDIARRSPDPVAVDSVLNDVKEKLLANIDGLRGGSDGTKQVGSKNVTMSDSEKLQVLNEIGAALALINDEGTASRFNMTNSAIWASWMAIDNLGVNPGCNAAPLPAPTSGSPGWADAYTSYMNSKLDQQKTAISNHIESIIATQGGWFTQTADNDGNLNLAGRGLEAFKTGYPESKWTMSTDAMLIWQPQPTYTPLGTATCYSPPTDADLSSFSMRFTSELGALSRAGVGTQPYSGRSMATTYPYLCSDGASTGSCWGYDFSTTAAYNSSSISTPSTFSTWFSSFTSGGSWSGNPLTPSPSPTRGSPTASLTSTRPYPTIITRSYPASSSAQSTTWATFSAANSSFVDSSSSWSGQSGTTSTLNPAFPTLPSSSDAQSSNSSSTLNPAFPTLPSSIGTQSGNSSSTTHVETVTATAYESTVVSVSVVHKTVIVPAPWSWYTSLPEATPATSTTSSSESSEASTTAAPPATTAAHPTENGGNPFKLSCGGGEQGMPIAAFDLATANKAIDYTCSAWYDAEGDEDARVYYAMHYGSGMENPIYFHISQQDTGGDCPDLYSQSDRSTAIATCKENFEYIVNTCDTSSNDFYWWKRGGTLIKDCYSWQIRRDEFNLKLMGSGYHRNDAVDPDDLESDDYRPDSSCTEWQDCPHCPGDVWQRKCISDVGRYESGACLCFDPTSGSRVAGALLDANASAPIATPKANVFSNTTGAKSLHFPRARLSFNASTIKTDSEISKASFNTSDISTASVNASAINAPFANTSTIKTALEANTAAGSLQCINAPQGPPRLNFELNGANAAIELACKRWADAIPGSGHLFNLDWSAPYEDPINLEILFVGNQRPRSRIRRGELSCGLPENPSRLDYFVLCTDNMQYILNTCNTKRNDHYWWKSGGTYTNDCWRWSLTRGSFDRLPDGILHNDAIGADDFTGVPDYLDYRPDSTCSQWQDCQTLCQLPGSQRKCRGDESNGPSYCVCKA